jgi:acylphosphatase
MEKIRAHVVISGRVQGVCYRQAAFQKAVELGLKGWVRNLNNGRVEAIFEGEEKLVNEMLEWCKEGPTMARVSHVEVDKQQCLDDFTDFRIKSTFGW